MNIFIVSLLVKIYNVATDVGSEYRFMFGICETSNMMAMYSHGGMLCTGYNIADDMRHCKCISLFRVQLVWRVIKRII